MTRLRWRIYGAGVRLGEMAKSFVTGDRTPMPPWRLRNVGSGDFRAVGREFLRIFVEHGGLEPHHRVLDVGCGVGRMALPLLDLLEPPGSYDGFDVVEESIRWCRRRIGGRRPDFRFHHADLHHPVYNPGGATPAAEYRFPFAESTFDFVFLTSVFTHLLERETRCYLGEVARVLRPGGRMLATFFLLGEPDAPPTQGSTFEFVHRLGAARVLDPNEPGRAVAYGETWVREVLVSVGLEIDEPVRYGRWSGRPGGLSLQDVLVAERRGRAEGAQLPRHTK